MGVGGGGGGGVNVLNVLFLQMLFHILSIASSPGHSQILSRSRGEKSGEGLVPLLCHGPEMVFFFFFFPECGHLGIPKLSQRGTKQNVVTGNGGLG